MQTDKPNEISTEVLDSKAQLAQLDARISKEVAQSKNEVAQLERLLANLTISLLLVATAFILIFYGLKGGLLIALAAILMIVSMFVSHTLYLRYKNKQLQNKLNMNRNSFLSSIKTVSATLSDKKSIPNASVKMITYEKMDTSFLSEHKELKRTYGDISDCYARYSATDLDERQSKHADGLMAVSNEVIKQLKVSYELNGGELNKLVPYIIPADRALIKLRTVHTELSQAIRRKSLQIASELEKIELPEYLVLENTLDELIARSTRLLKKLKADPLYESSEEKTILSKIVSHRLNELWLTYTNAKAEGSTDNGSSERAQHPDQVLSEIFVEIDGFLDRLEGGVNDYQKTQAMNNLLTDKRYFKDRFS